MRMLGVRFKIRSTMVAASAALAATVGAVATARQVPGGPEGGSGRQPTAAASGRTGERLAAGEPEVRRQFKVLIAENQDAAERIWRRLQTAQDRGREEAYIRANWPPEKKVVGGMLEVARRHPEDPTSFDALAWVVILGYNTTASDAAADALAQRYGPEKRLWLICQEMRRGVISPARGIMLRAVVET